MASSEDPTNPLPEKKIAIIIGSTRAVRIGPSVAQFVKKTLDEAPASPAVNTTLHIVDIATFNLPVFDEPVIPAMVPAQAQFVHQHSKDWNAEIAKYDAYVVVSAEYNFGVPGALKNAIDYLYSAWIGKPVLLVTYGILGGNNASEGLKRTLEGMHLQVVGKRAMLEFPGRDEAHYNMSPGSVSAMVGKLEEQVVKYWEEARKGEILEGWEELRGLVAAKEVKN
jgi:NAD(P)H-dependent FMN reductase